MHDRRSSLIVTALTVLTLALHGDAQVERRYSARLTTVPLDFINKPAITGSGAVTAELTGDTLSLSGTFENLSSPATRARLHIGNGATGVRGPAFADLTIANAARGTIKGSIVLKPPQLTALRSGRLYIQVHSEKAPDGNLWGWLLTTEP